MPLLLPVVPPLLPVTPPLRRRRLRRRRSPMMTWASVSSTKCKLPKKRKITIKLFSVFLECERGAVDVIEECISVRLLCS